MTCNQLLLSHPSQVDLAEIAARRGIVYLSACDAHVKARLLPPHATQVDPAEIEICTRPGGEPWLLGSGAYGQVRKQNTRVINISGLVVVA